jgi:glyoxylase-like metal-dependent hydrolase (beta-lactamase superfamily II)
VKDGYFVEPVSQYLLRTEKKFRVHGWIKDGGIIDLGGRKIRIISTPGHTPDSISLIDAGGSHVFTGDLVNRIVTLDDVPGSDVKASAASLHRLLTYMPAGGVAYEAHAEAPITRSELQELATGVDQIAAGTANSKPMCLGGISMRRFDVGAFAVVLPTTANDVLKPLGSATETLDWLGEACRPTGRPAGQPHAGSAQP